VSKVRALEDLVAEREALRREGRRLAFTNGCFELLHAGHVDLLRRARAEADSLVVAVNDDASVRRLKGPGRPVAPLEERLEVLEAVRFVDRLVSFSEDTPLRLIEALQPDVLVKGADWPLESIVGREAVEAAGGRVVRVPLRPGLSTSELLRRARERT
jgi:rfaE bifunctional protein nucleotidyltransferase chain/domain